ncbi:MAG: hypothetical protein C7B43_06290 [Sulfobacillus benefaciens]|uniref:Uncharacterized protein n=1 Tax=Sulfobacillus benefaciens TaxID=453960 RepID=A0A2T2X742_9FIRM|nr:MAG: hypothetical protein C7B43_06290 [Sulfobacillus benefaciens]
MILGGVGLPEVSAIIPAYHRAVKTILTLVPKAMLFASSAQFNFAGDLNNWGGLCSRRNFSMLDSL